MTDESYLRESGIELLYHMSTDIEDPACCRTCSEENHYSPVYKDFLCYPCHTMETYRQCVCRKCTEDGLPTKFSDYFHDTQLFLDDQTCPVCYPRPRKCFHSECSTVIYITNCDNYNDFCPLCVKLMDGTFECARCKIDFDADYSVDALHKHEQQCPECYSKHEDGCGCGIEGGTLCDGCEQKIARWHASEKSKSEKAGYYCPSF